MHTRRRISHYALGAIPLGVTAGLIYWVLRSVSWFDLKTLIFGSNWNFLLLFCALSLTGVLVRAWRTQILLRSSNYAVPIFPLFLITLVRNVCADLLPARLGTTVSAFLVVRKLKVSAPVASSVWAQEYIFDLISIAPLLIGIPILISLPEGWNGAFLGGGLLLLIIFGAILLLLPAMVRFGNLTLSTLLKRTHVAPRVVEWANQFLTQVARDTQHTQSTGIYRRILILSLCVRGFKYGGLYILFEALVRPLGIPDTQLRAPEALAGLLAAELSNTLPITTIGGFGVYEGTWGIAFALLGLDQSLALLTGVAHHLITQLWAYSLGIFAILLLCIPTPWGSKPSQSTHSYFWPQFTALITGIALCISAAHSLPPLNAQNNSELKNETKTPEQAHRAAALTFGLRSGQVIFDSNRSGSFGIYSIDIASQQLTQIVDSPAHEMYPDPAPNGRQIVFARTQSLLRIAPSQIFLANTDGTNERLLSADGTFPTFSSDGTQVFFERGRRSVWSISLETGQESLVFPLPADSFRGAVVKPRISSDGNSLVFTSDKPHEWHAQLVNLQSRQRTLISEGCEPTFSDKADEVAYIKQSGLLEGSGVMLYNREKKIHSLLHDAGKPYGHEYFPSLHAGKYLLYAACSPGQHSHTEADYQIFISEIYTGERIQLTHDMSTNRWPKLIPAH